MTHIDLDPLERIAKAATQGDWHEARYVVAFDPPTALALIARIRELDAAREAEYEIYIRSLIYANTQAEKWQHKYREATGETP